MKPINRILLFLMFIFFTFIPQVAYAVDSDIVISEIAAYENSDHEWIEIYNKGVETVDLTGWKFFEDGTNHGLSSFRGGLVIQPGSYAVIADTASNTATDYPQYQGILIDSSWTTLNESGELIGLKRVSGSIIEQFTYGAAPNHSLERIDPNSADYTSANWKEHPTGNTIGSQYVQQVSAPPTQQLPAQVMPQAQYIQKPGRGSVVVNELVSDPSDEEKEWIELYNSTPNAIDLAGWSIVNGSGKSIFVSGILQGAGAAKYRAVEMPGGTLKNLGDKASLLDPEKNVIDTVSYGSWDDGTKGDNAQRAINPYALARKTDGYNTYMNSNDFAVTTTPTMGAANVITLEPPQTQSKESQSKLQPSVVISELFPNPASHNPTDEFIELYNESAADIDLAGWRVSDEEESEFVFLQQAASQTVLKSKEYIVIGRDVSGIALNNIGGDTIKLYEPGSQKALATVRYSDTAHSNMSYSRNVHGRYAWTLEASPKAQNRIVIPNRPPSLSVEWPANGAEQKEIIFDATDTFDPDSDALILSWDFGDGAKAKGLYVAHTYLSKGTYMVTARAADEIHEEVQTHRVVIGESKKTDGIQAVHPLPMQKEEILFPVVLNELYPNPTGSDAGEFIELKNNGEVIADLSGWSMEIGANGKRFVIPGAIAVPPLSYQAISKSDASFSLTNTYEAVALLSPSGIKVDAIDYDDAPSGMSYARTTRGDWLWTKRISIGKDNDVDDVYDERSEEHMPSVQEPLSISRPPSKSSQQNGIECTITAVPGIVGKGIAYCGDPPLRIRFTAQALPEMHEGDRFRLTGKISHPNGQTVLTVKNISDGVKKSSGKKIVPRDIELNDLSDDELASLIRVSGSVTKIQWPSMWIRDGENELRAYIYKTTSIARPQVFVGDGIDMAGILDKTSAGYRLLPRSTDDMHITQKEQPADTTDISLPVGEAQSPQKSSYILATLAALAIVSGGLIMQHLGKKK